MTDVFACPVDGCTWAHTEPPLDVPEMALAGVFGPGVMASVARTQRHERIERALHQHLEGHPRVDFVRTITRLEKALREADEAGGQW